MINSVTICGNLCDEPKISMTQNGKKRASFTIALNNGKTKDGKELAPDYINCTAWDYTAEFLERYAKKGNKATVNGQIKTNKWEDAQGKHSTTYVLAKDIELMSARDTQENVQKQNFVQDTLVGGGVGLTGQHEESFTYADIKTDDLPFY